MAEYQLSRRAGADLVEIAVYSIENFGIRKAREYRANLFRAFETLAAQPLSGTECGHLRRGVRRLAHERHVIYYRRRKFGVWIVRILHADRDQARHL